MGSLNVAALEQVSMKSATIMPLYAQPFYKYRATDTYFSAQRLPIVGYQTYLQSSEPAAQRKAVELAQQPFDLVQGPLFQAQYCS